MYLWELVGRDATEVSPRCGIGGDLGRVMRTVEAELAKFPGFDGQVNEVVRRISVSSLDTVHVPTGREWLARQDEDGGACWEGRYRSADPEVAYDLAALGETPPRTERGRLSGIPGKARAGRWGAGGQ